MPDFKKDTDGFMNKPSGFKMKGFSGFHGSSPMQKTDGSSPMTIGPNLGISADTKTKDEVRGAQAHVAGVIEKEEKRADRKERKAEKAASKGKDKKAARKQRKADKIRAALSPLQKKVPSIPKKDESPATVVANLQKKKENGTITQAELKKLKKLQTMMETGPGSYGNEQWDKE
jgi:hypothetical protein